MPRQAALAFNRLDHRAFFTADICASATPHSYLGVPGKARGFDLRYFVPEDFENGLVFIADVDEDLFGLYRPSADQHALQKSVRSRFQVVSVFERSRLAFVTVDSHQPWALVTFDKAPFLSRWEAGTAKPPQAAI